MTPLHSRVRVLWLAGCLSACTYGALPEDALCEAIAASTAAHVMACTGDTAAANARYDQVLSHYECPGALDAHAYACVPAVRRAPCAGTTQASELEYLFKRAAPVCSERLRNTGPSAPLPPGLAHAEGTVNGASVRYDCAFAATQFTAGGSDAGAVRGAATCLPGTFGFSLSIDNLQVGEVYTAANLGQPIVGGFVLPGVGGTDNGTTQLYRLSFSEVRFDANGYLRLIGAFRIVRSGSTLSYDLAGNIDLVLSPPAEN